MTANRQNQDLTAILHELRSFPKETSWVEFKHNNSNPEEIGEYISALSNSAALEGKIQGWLVWGVDDDSHDLIGTDFRYDVAKVGNEELESWLLRLLAPRIQFRFYQLQIEADTVVMLEICAATQHPVSFKNVEYIRIGSYKKPLKGFPEKERELWRIFDRTRFEDEIAAEHVPAEDVLAKLNYPVYFDLLKIPLPEGRDGILGALEADSMITRSSGGRWNITNLGGIVFAKQLSDFRGLQRKSVRVIQYKDTSRLATIRELDDRKGYACGFNSLIGYIDSLLPKNEIISRAFRREVSMFPPEAVRELVANAIIHQDFRITGTSPMIEIFSDRLEITNPGLPLVRTDRFLDSPPRSRNEILAGFMRRINICEERGSGIDKVVASTEDYQLPAPLFETTEQHTRAILFAHKALRDMDKEDRIRACYLHACLKYVQKQYMTNSSLRERLAIEDANSAMASRIINETIKADYIKVYNELSGNKYRKYLPIWA